MKKWIFPFIIVILMFSFSGCHIANISAPDSLSENNFINEYYPSFTVENVDASKGDNDVVVYVSLKDNPGFLTMAMNIEYDSDNMSLIEVVNGADYQEYNFIGPKNMQSGCTATWFTPELKNVASDGVILELHFHIAKTAQSGSYPISVLRPTDGGIVGADKETLVFNNAIGYINIK